MMSSEQSTAPARAVTMSESRWPVVFAVIFVSIATFLVPAHDKLGSGYFLLALEAILIIIQIIADPGAIDRQSGFLRGVTVAMVSVLALASFGNSMYLVHELVVAASNMNNGTELLRVGGAVWVSNTVVFALLYWTLDGGGAAKRAHVAPEYPAFLFPEYSEPDLVVPGWRPMFLDYLHVAFTTSTAFSPTDVVPFKRWSKTLMTAQALTSFCLIGLVVARAVNILQ